MGSELTDLRGNLRTFKFRYVHGYSGPGGIREGKLRVLQESFARFRMWVWGEESVKLERRRTACQKKVRHG